MCPKCGQKLLEKDDNFCTKCKADLKPYQIKCPGCGRVIGSELIKREIAWDYCCFCAAEVNLEVTV